MKKYPPTNIRLFCKIFEWAHLHYEPNTGTWRGFLLQLFCYFNQFIAVLQVFLHLLNTVCRSFHYMPEFYQMLAEDSAMIFCYFKVYLLYHRYSEIKYLADFMENSFSNADESITNKFRVKANMTCLVYMMSVFSIWASLVFQFLLPITKEELANRSMVYKTKFPSRRTFTNLYIPYVDESELLTYIGINMFEMYVLFIYVVAGLAMLSLIPALVTHVEGQYRMLNIHVENIGKIHTDRIGNTIQYINIEENHYRIMKTDDNKINKPSTSKQSKAALAALARLARRRQRNLIWYEQNYVKQLVKYHQKLLTFQSKVGNILCLVESSL
uniref:Odorant receptor n=1 Tax=Cacopsylla melanoneura TaxID=428564 RepID=A0A8D9EUM1_9HEMI